MSRMQTPRLFFSLRSPTKPNSRYPNLHFSNTIFRFHYILQNFCTSNPLNPPNTSIVNPLRKTTNQDIPPSETTNHINPTEILLRNTTNRETKPPLNPNSPSENIPLINPNCIHGPLSDCSNLSCNVEKIINIVTHVNPEDIASSLSTLCLKTDDHKVFILVLKHIQKMYMKPLKEPRRKKARVVARSFLIEKQKGIIFKDPILAKEGAKRALNLYFWLGKQNVFSYSEALCIEMAVTLVKSNYLERLMKFLHEMLAYHGDSVMTRWVLTSVVHALGKEGFVEYANHFMMNMEREFNCRPDRITCHAYMNALCMIGRVSHARVILEKMQFPGRWWCSADSYSYTIVINGHCHVSFYSKHRKFGKLKYIKQARRIFRLMKFHGFACVTDTYNCLIDAHCRHFKLKFANMYLGQMDEDGCSPDCMTYHPFVKYYVSEKNLHMAIRMLEEMKARNVRPWARSYELIIHALCKAKRFQEACEILKEMVEAGLAPRISVFEGVKNGKEDYLPCDVWKKIESAVQMKIQDDERIRRIGC